MRNILNKITIKHLMVVTVILIAGVASAQFFLSQIIASRTNDLKEQNSKLVSAMLAAKESRFHIAQTQQFLTDRSVTGNEDVQEEAKASLDAAHYGLNQLAQLFREVISFAFLK